MTRIVAANLHGLARLRRAYLSAMEAIAASLHSHSSPVESPLPADTASEQRSAPAQVEQGELEATPPIAQHIATSPHIMLPSAGPSLPVHIEQSKLEPPLHQVQGIRAFSHTGTPLPVPPLHIDITPFLNKFVVYPRCFTLTEFVDLLDAEEQVDEIRRALLNDHRFVRITQGKENEEYFVSERALFLWWSYLTVRVAQTYPTTLTEYQLAGALSLLRQKGRWDTPPEPAISFGRQFGFVDSSSTPGQYVFPMAHVLSYLPPFSLETAMKVLEGFADSERRSIALEQSLEETVKKGFSSFKDKRMVQIVRAREGLESGDKLTLEQIGRRLGVTRERIRQIEDKFWRRSLHPSRRRLFVEALLCDLIRHRGSLVLRAGSSDTPMRKFLAKCAHVPCTAVPHTDLLVIGTSTDDFASLPTFKVPPDQELSTFIAGELNRLLRHLCLSSDDLLAIANSLGTTWAKPISKAEEVYLALRKIGKLAHYSEITSVHNSMFPEHESTERNILATLGRKQNGIVWVGIQGTYALEEWGYEQPSQPLFDQVTEIVRIRHEETGKPVPFSVIAAEIGKYRQIVKQTSLLFATQCNSALRRVSRDTFVPKGTDELKQEEITANELHNILEEFKRRNEWQRGEKVEDS